LEIVKFGCGLAIVRASSLGFGLLSGIALYFLFIPGIIIVLIGLLVRKFRPLKRGSPMLGFEMAEWQSLIISGMIWLTIGAVLVFLEVAFA
jgi:high-affinity K+ transport system ATPase subunit B